jgi:hypothetical protein
VIEAAIVQPLPPDTMHAEHPWRQRMTVLAACCPFYDDNVRIVKVEMAFLSRLAGEGDGSKVLGVKVREGSQEGWCVMGSWW